MHIKTALSGCTTVLKGHILKRPKLLNVTLTTNTRCNFKCNYCKIWKREGNELTTSQIEDLIDQLSFMGTQRLGLTGGEPLLREDIGHLIDYAKSRGIFVSLNTNGSLVEERIKELGNLDLIILSLDGEEDVHNLHKRDDAYGQVMRAIKAAKGAELKVMTTTTLTRHNLNSVNFILHKAQEMGFRAAFQLLHHPQSAAGDTTSLLPSSEGYRKTIKELISLKGKYPKVIINSKRYFEILFKWLDYRQVVLETSPFKVRCWAGRFYCHIDVNGDVYPCHQLLKSLKVVPNIQSLPLREALMNLPPTPCILCSAGDYLEYNLLFSLNLSALRNLLYVL
ncbi:MAG: radical SAM protein [Thermodesulfobacteriota bacterium]